MEQFFENIAVAFEGSEASVVAYNLAETMHKRFQSRLNLIHIEENGKGVVAKVDEFIEKKKNEGIPINLLHKKGSIYKSIVKATEELDADLIIMGTHGIFGVQEFWMGSNAYRVVSSAPCPVITMQESFKRNDIKKIVLPIDTSDETRQKIPYASKMAESFNATIYLLGVSTDSDSETQKYIRIYCNQAEEFFDRHKVKYEREEILGGNITNNTIDYAKKIDADLIMIMTEQEPNSSAFFMGKFAQQMVNHSPIPVMSIRPREIGIAGGSGY
ncbi:MAG: universal stress protein [Bacteroidia bacterium]|nr:universal stress protein [Bacteroidia bacterium]MBP7260038.1 universal stress protein [Bacteroidia bacterium]MBP9179127.1 universal stress protein [Bacteroidia bacterium]MBP9723664.1 universal stress protein [Bacteroidia bacterium]